MNALLLVLMVQGPQPNLIVQVDLLGVGSIMAECILTTDSTLLMPARDVAELLGLDEPTSQWTSIAALKLHWPPITVEWFPRELRVVIRDDLAVLPATRRMSDQRLREARRASVYMPSRSGPFLAFAADERQHYVTDVGYSWRGRVRVQARHGSAFGSQWGASIAPTRSVFVAYADGQRQPATVSGRLAVGPLWVAPTWQEHRPVSVDGLVAVGPVQMFASSRDVYVLTIQSRAGDLQVSRSRGVMAARLSWGPIPASPFSPVFVP